MLLAAVFFKIQIDTQAKTFSSTAHTWYLKKQDAKNFHITTVHCMKFYRHLCRNRLLTCNQNSRSNPKPGPGKKKNSISGYQFNYSDIHYCYMSTKVMPGSANYVTGFVCDQSWKRLYETWNMAVPVRQVEIGSTNDSPEPLLHWLRNVSLQTNKHNK